MPYKDIETQKAYLRAYDREYYKKNREHLLIKQKEKINGILKKSGRGSTNIKKDCRVQDVLKHIRQLFSFIIETERKSFSSVCLDAENIVKRKFWRKFAKCEVICANCHAEEHCGYLYE